MRPTFLLGSGISIPAGLSNVRHLTEVVLSGDGLRLDGQGIWYDDACDRQQELSAGASSTKLQEILLLLDWLKDQASIRFKDELGSAPTYEDLAYLAGQIYNDHYGNFENPAIRPFVRNAVIDLKGLWRNSSPDELRRRLGELAGDAVSYIRQVVAGKLNQPPNGGDYFKVFKDASRDPEVLEMNLFTLNHDTLLERALAQDSVVVGLKVSPDGSLRWDPAVFDAPEARVKVFKMHGSINWHRWRRRVVPAAQMAGNRSEVHYSQFIGDYSALDQNSPLFELADSSEGPMLLAGTFNKMLDYSKGIFLELQHRFLTALQHTNTLVICGYGFGDKGINTRIVEWRHQSPQNQLLLIDPAKPVDLLKGARGAIKREIAGIDAQNEGSTLPAGLVHHWPNGLQEMQPSNGMPIVTWERIRAVIRNLNSPD